jgi:hypothetical protein
MPNEIEKRDDEARASGAPGEDEAGSEDSATPGISRRKLMYASPAILSERLIYALAGCGKGDPRLTPCQQAPMGGS